MKLRNVKHYREKLIMTQQALSEKSGVSIPAIHRAETDGNVRISTVHKLASALGVKPEQLR